MKNKVIGLGCIALVGKDSFFNILTKYLSVKRMAFADSLKQAVSPLTKQYLNIEATTNNPKEKEIIRPILVAFGNAARNQNHRIWIDKITPRVKEAIDAKYIPVITDVRFAINNGNDEADYIQNELEGILINIDRILPDGSLVQPANESEAKNYPIIKARADVCIVASNLQELEEQIVEKVLPLVKK